MGRTPNIFLYLMIYIMLCGEYITTSFNNFNYYNIIHIYICMYVCIYVYKQLKPQFYVRKLLRVRCDSRDQGLFYRSRSEGFYLVEVPRYNIYIYITIKYNIIYNLTKG
jgi:hypothetical protein